MKQIRSKVHLMTNEHIHIVLLFLMKCQLKSAWSIPNKYLDLVEGYKDFSRLGRTEKLTSHVH